MAEEFGFKFEEKPKAEFSAGWAAVITVVVMLIVAAGGYYYLSQKQKQVKDDLNNQIITLKKSLAESQKAAVTSSSATSTTNGSNLKTYTNQTYGYLFQYPAADSLIDYLYDTQTAQKIEYGKIVVVDKKTIAENALKNQSEVPTSYFMITAQSDHQFGLSELTSGLAESGGELSDVTVDGVAGWKIHYTQPSVMDDTYSTSIYVNHGAYGFTLSWKNSDAAGTHDAAIDAIVKNFKWL